MQLGVLSIGILLAVTMTIKTINQQNIWKNSITLWSSSVDYLKDSPGVYKFGEDTPFYTRGSIYYKKGMFAEASKDVSYEIILFPEKIKSYKLRAKSYFYIGEYEKSAKDYDYIISHEPPDSENFLT